MKLPLLHLTHRRLVRSTYLTGSHRQKPGTWTRSLAPLIRHHRATTWRQPHKSSVSAPPSFTGDLNRSPGHLPVFPLLDSLMTFPFKLLSLVAPLTTFSSGFLGTYLIALSLVSHLSATSGVRSVPGVSQVSSHKHPHLWVYFCVQGLNTIISEGLAPPSSHPALTPLLSIILDQFVNYIPDSFT